MNCHAANRRAAAQRSSCPLEVFVPQVDARVEEVNEFACVPIGSRDVRTFVPIAMQTSESEILNDGLAPVLACNYVIHVKGQRIDVSGKVTILASLSCALPDFPDNIPIHE